jgi:hypothetical protein
MSFPEDIAFSRSLFALLTFENVITIGLKSGEYGGKKCTMAPTSWIISTTVDGAIIHYDYAIAVNTIKGLQLW